MFYHFPFGASDRGSVMNYSPPAHEQDYVYFFDQEPVQLDLHQTTFQEVSRRAYDLTWHQGATGHIITSEMHSDVVDHICREFGWRSHYYFFHGWAALDWFRGYDRSFLIAGPEQRKINHSFISPNRIVSGRRLHRSILMYHLLRQGLRSALISFPAVCPYSGRSVIEETQCLSEQYADISSVFAQARLPWDFPGESGHPMHSYQLSLFDLCERSMCYVATETVWQGRRQHLTEKIFKPICLRMPFVLVGTAGSLEYLRSYGFRSFGDLWDESYDLEQDDHRRLKKISELLLWFDNLDQLALQNLYTRAIPILEHNHDHFYRGGFESVLWQELNGMLASISKDLD